MTVQFSKWNQTLDTKTRFTQPQSLAINLHRKNIDNIEKL